MRLLSRVSVGWNLIDLVEGLKILLVGHLRRDWLWNLYDENNVFLCSIKIAHGKNTKEEVVANSVDKVRKIFKERIYVPEDIARFLREPGALTHLREFLKLCHRIRI